jgi:hypothetical protein
VEVVFPSAAAAAQSEEKDSGAGRASAHATSVPRVGLGMPWTTWTTR